MTPLEAAIAAGETAWGVSRPNPPVGAAIVVDEAVVATGATSPVGGPHAEINALTAARTQGVDVRGATMYVTLEPCNSVGRTPPCSHALVAAGLSRVVYLNADPNPAMAGGATYLREHGVEVAVQPTPVAALTPWLAAQRLGRPQITVKLAQTLDGFAAASDGSSQWITSEVARTHVHRDRSHRDAIIVGTGTVLADNPQLTARRRDGSLYPTQPVRIVLGARPLPPHLTLATPDGTSIGHVASIDELLARARENQWVDLLVEGGPHTLSSFFAADLVDVVDAYVAPALLGGGRSVLAAPFGTTLASIRRFVHREITPLGPDVLLTLTDPERNQ